MRARCDLRGRLAPDKTKPANQTGFAICSPGTIPKVIQEGDQFEVPGHCILSART
jgi:hypothetical protein